MEDVNREIMVGKNRFYLNKNNIMYVEINGDINLECAKEMKNAYLKLLSGINDKVDILVDNNNTGIPSQEARNMLSDLIKDENINKIAVFSFTPVARVIGAFVLGRISKTNTKIFKSKTDAIKWLKNKD
jgi:hypothetical protein